MFVADDDAKPDAFTLTTYLDDGSRKLNFTVPSEFVAPLALLKLSEVLADTTAPTTALPLESTTLTFNAPVSSAEIKLAEIATVNIAKE